MTTQTRQHEEALRRRAGITRDLDDIEAVYDVAVRKLGRDDDVTTLLAFLVTRAQRRVHAVDPSELEGLDDLYPGTAGEADAALDALRVLIWSDGDE